MVKFKGDFVAKCGECDEAFEIVIIVGSFSADMQEKIDFGRCGDDERPAHFTSSSDCSFFWSSTFCVCSGPKASA